MLEETRVTPEFIVEMDKHREFPKGGKLVEECSKSVVFFLHFYSRECKSLLT